MKDRFLPSLSFISPPAIQMGMMLELAPGVPRRVMDDERDGRAYFEGLSYAASRERTGTPE